MQEKSIKLSTTKETLSNLIARISHNNIAAILVRRNTRESNEPLGTFHVEKETFDATASATEILDLCRADADVMGGSVSYLVSFCSDSGVVITSTTVSVQTGLPSADGFRGMSAENAYFAKHFDTLFGKSLQFVTALQNMNDRLSSQNEKLISQVFGGLESVQKALDMSTDRDIKKAEAESDIKTKEAAFSAFSKAAAIAVPQYLVSRGMSADLAATITSSFLSEKQETIGQEKPSVDNDSFASGLADIFSSVGKDNVVKWLESLPDERKNSLLQMVPKDKLQKLISLLG